MALRSSIASGGRMASPWRRRPICILIADRAPSPGALREISGAGAFVETNVRPPLGVSVELRHPEAGAIHGLVASHATDGVQLRFDRGERAVAFALAAIASDMSRPPAT